MVKTGIRINVGASAGRGASSSRRGQARLWADRQQEHSTATHRSPSALTRPAPAPMRSLRAWRRSPARRPECRRRCSLTMVPTPGCRCSKAARSSSASSIFSIPIWPRPGPATIKKPIQVFASSPAACFRLPRGSSCATSRTSNRSADLKGKRVAWDYGGHAINQTWQNGGDGSGRSESLPTSQQVRVSNFNDGVRAVPEGKVDAAFTAVGIGVVEEANAMEADSFLEHGEHAGGE